MPNIDVIVPIYKPNTELYKLLEWLRRQTLKPTHILLVNTGKKYWDEFLNGRDITTDYPEVSVIHVEKADFDHGGTRKMAAGMTKSPIFVMMTQDAVPVDEFLLENLTKQLMAEGQPQVAVAYARQLAGKKSGSLEQISRSFNYPATSRTKTKEDAKELGIKTAFCSDVCAAYRRDIYERLGGFVTKTLFNEDMIYAQTALDAGYAIRYEAEAKVLHAHNYTLKAQLMRNFDLGVSQAQYPEVFGRYVSESEGMKLLRKGTGMLARKGRILEIPYFYVQCVAKYIGFKLGKAYNKLPRNLILKLTTNRDYWK